MTKVTTIRIAEGSEEPLADFVVAWHRADAGTGDNLSVLVFNRWETLCVALAGARYDLLRHLHASPAKSVEELAATLGRSRREIVADVDLLENAGLLVRTSDWIRPQADRFRLEILKRSAS